MTDLRTAAQQALEAMRCAVPTGKITLADWHKSIAELEAVLAQQVKHVAWMRPWPPVRAQQAEPVLQTCNCRWDGEVQVQQCTLHEAHVDAIHEWAERAKVAERKLAQQAEPVDQTTLDVSGTTSFSAIPPKLPEPYAGKAARLNNDRIQIDPATGNVSIGAQQAEPVHLTGLSIRAQSTIGRWLNEDMDRAVANGANSISMPDELVEIAAWLHAQGEPVEPMAYTAPPQRKPLTEEEIVEAVREADLDWQAGWTLDEHEPNRFTTLVRAVERAHGIGDSK